MAALLFIYSNQSMILKGTVERTGLIY